MNLLNAAEDDMLDDFNTPKALSRYFELCNKINALNDGKFKLSEVSNETINAIKKNFPEFIFNVLGLKHANENENSQTVDGLMDLVIDLRQEARVERKIGVYQIKLEIVLMDLILL